ncbi:hypothetical protein CCMA1212_008237 [Trichoderma ghanense]|uniref:Secreted protein n=1 Tax=Trichoderma ghanense TaxID=65468 RepID=A0ABY2GYI2_9HYPO
MRPSSSVLPLLIQLHCRQPLRWRSRRLNMLYLMQPARSHGLMASIGRCKNWPKKAYPCNTLWARAARPRYYYEYHLEEDTSRGVH